MPSIHHPGIDTEFVVFYNERTWYTCYHGSDSPIELEAEAWPAARAEASDYWGIPLEEIKREDSSAWDWLDWGND
jgi:hypothetical protein